MQIATRFVASRGLESGQERVYSYCCAYSAKGPAACIHGEEWRFVTDLGMGLA
jgi:hypothetical protein